MTSVIWDTAKVELLKTLWASGFSSGQIVEKIPGTTRSGILGKVHRLGLGTHTLTASQARKPTKTKSTATQAPKRTIAWLAPVAPTDYSKTRSSLLDLTDASCRFPIGDGADMFFCGSPEADLASGHPYCRYHESIAWTSRRATSEEHDVARAAGRERAAAEQRYAGQQ